MRISKPSQLFRLRIALAVVTIHLALVIIGASEIEFSGGSWGLRAINYYGELSGASSGYGFFAPGVSSQVRCSFDILEKDSSKITQQLKDQSSREVDIRLGDIVEQFLGEERSDPKQFQRELAGSLSGLVFARHPGAKSVTIRLETFTPVSMQDYRNGQRPNWMALYSAKFVNRGELLR
jgi:hypothetical protein